MGSVEELKEAIGGPGEGDEPEPGALPERWAEIAARRWFWPLVFVGGYFAQFAFRLAMVFHRSFPSVQADESSYLVVARILAGRSGTEMPNDTLVPGGYPLLISPAIRFFDDPVRAYQAVLGINALINALIFPLLFVALRRLNLPKPLSALLAFGVALLPPVVFYAEFAMADAVFQVLVMAWVIAMFTWLSEGPLRRRYLFGTATGLVAGYAMATHDRGTIMVVLTGLVMVGALVFNWAPRRTTLAALASLAVGVAFAKLLWAYLAGQFVAKSAGNDNVVIKSLTDPTILGRTIARTFGQFWYLMISSWGIGAIGVALCLYALFSKRIARPGRIVSFCLLAMTAGVALASAAALGDDPRIDNWVYARYLSPLVPVFFVIGAAAVYHLRRKQTVLLTLAGLGLMAGCAEIVILYAGKELYRQAIIQWAMPDALFLANNYSALHMWETMTGVLVIVAGCVLMRLSGGRRVMGSLAVVLTLLAAFATASVTEQIADTYAKWRKIYGPGFSKDAGVRRDDQVVFDWDVDWNLRMTQNYELYWGRMWTLDLEHNEKPPAGATLVVVPAPEAGKPATSSWPSPPPGWYVDRVDPKVGWVTWRHH